MQYHRLGSSGLHVPELTFGTVTFGGPPYGTTSADQARELVSRCLDAGLTLFDSADIYGAGASLEILGAAVRGRRDRLLMSSKIGLPTGESAAQRGAGRSYVLSAVDATLERLQTDHLDLLYLHTFDAGTPLEETAAVLGRLVSSGRVRYLGASNFTAWQLMKALGVQDSLHTARFVSQQSYYSLLGRDFEFDLMEVGADQGIGTLVWSPLAGGWLSGTIRRGQPPAPGSRVDRMGAYGPPVDQDILLAVMDVLDAISAETGRTVPQIAINWLLRRPTVCSVVIGADDAAQLENNLGAVGWSLTADQVARLDAASTTATPYPNYLYHRDPGFRDLAPALLPRPR
ncbi:aldo/keto reductase [Mycolicibacterium sp.]|uniref:aldo/keto reductase n=1 Tax=Mycolicibacterium sp. TaxID=2320850 RepID=UPI003D14D1DC